MTQAAQLIGRGTERSAVDDLLRQVGSGASGALVVRGEPGIGKSAILDYAAKAAAGFIVLQVTGIESEMEVAFSGLQQACAPLAGHLGRLPAPQAEALRVAFGLTAAIAPPERFLVGLGVLGLMAEVAADQPVLCLVDDAQWIDQASLHALGFAARRLQRESVAMIFGARAGFAVPEVAALTELTLAGLTEADARRLLTAAVPGRLDEQVQDRIIAEAAGNPLALLEFSHEITESGDLAGGFGVSPLVARPLADRVAERFLARVGALPAATRRLLLLAAAEPLGDPGLLQRAGVAFGTDIDDLAPAEIAGLVRLGAKVTFRHPLVRSAIYRSAPAVDRQAAHAALAEATVAEHDQDRRAWHRAHATLGPDEASASELEQSAQGALTRGGPAAAAAFLERAAALSPDPAERARRNLAAAQSKYDAGAPGAAGSLISAAVAGPLDALQRARADQLAARIATVIRIGGDPPGLLLKAARRFGPLDAALARRTYLDAIMSAMILGDPGGTRWLQVAEAARDAPPAPASARPRSDDLLLDALAALANDGYQAALPELRDALRAFLAEDPAGSRSTGAVGVLWLACQTAMNLWDDVSWAKLSGRLLASARGNGVLIDYVGALSIAALVAILSGDFTAAAACNDESEIIAGITRTYVPVHGRLALAAWRGSPGAEGLAVPGDRGTNRNVRLYTTALLGNSLGRYEEALRAAQLGCENADHLGYPLWALPELAEAAARCGHDDLAAQAVARLAETTAVSGTDWGLGMLARSRALVSAGESAEASYREAIDRLGRTALQAHLARAHLLYGEWLRREKRRADARAQLRTASQMFTAMGAVAFAGRADRELAATGERIRRRDAQPVVELTPQEAQIARLASEGQSNPEIAAQLYLSPRTVEYHLSKIFAKLDIGSRGQLARALTARQTGRLGVARESTDAGAPPAGRGWDRQRVADRRPISERNFPMPEINRFRQGPFAPVTTEATAFDLPVTGAVPTELSGCYLRNGPNPIGLDGPGQHWFTGAGMVHGVRLRDGRAEWYRNRWVRSRQVAEALGESWPKGPVHAGADFAANTHIIRHAGRTLATVEAGALPYELDAELGTLGPCDFAGKLPGGFAAHTKVDPLTGELHAIAYFWAWDYIQHIVISADGEQVKTANIPVADGPMIHDFALTEKYVVLFDLPVTFSMTSAGAGAQLPYTWNPDHQARVGLLHRDGSSPEVRWLEVEPCWIFHTLNAYDDGGTVVVDLVQYAGAYDVSLLSGRGPVTLDRWTIDPAAGKVLRRRLDDRPQEFPRVDERLLSRPHRYGYSAVIGEVSRATVSLSGDFADQAFANALLKHDLAANSVQAHEFGRDATAGEAVFVPSSASAAEDDGYVMAFVHAPDRGAADLVILAAQDFGGEPVARIHLPARIPLGFHGSWIPDL